MPDNQDTTDQIPGTEPDTGSLTSSEADPTAAKKAAAKTAKKTTTKTAAKKTAAKKTAAKTAKKTTTKTAAKKTAAKKTSKKADSPAEATTDTAATAADTAAEAPATDAAPADATKADAAKADATKADEAAAKKTSTTKTAAKKSASKKSASASVLFQAPEVTEPAPKTDQGDQTDHDGPSGDQGDQGGQRGQSSTASTKGSTPKTAKTAKTDDNRSEPEQGEPSDTAAGSDTGSDSGSERESADGSEGGSGSGRRRRRRGGRRRRKANGDANGNESTDASDGSEDGADESDSGSGGSSDGGSGGNGENEGGSGGSRRRRRRRRSGESSSGSSSDDPNNTVTKVRKGRSAEDQITAVTGSTRLEAKRQRRREGREAGRRRAPIVSEAEFLARRESVERVMVIRQRDDLTQIGVLEDDVLVEHYVARESQTSLIGNVYLGRVQNVLPSMEAAFIDIGKGRNAVLYAGEVNWSALGHKEGEPRKIESVLSSGQSVMVQVTKDPIGHKGARLTSQISLAGRFLVYVPDGTTSGISRKLPDNERSRLKKLLKEIVPDSAGVIVRTAAEGASEQELTRDVERLTARWNDIESKARGNGPKLLYGEPDLTLKVVRDLFTEDFSKLVIEGEDAWSAVHGYVAHVAPDLEDRLERFDAPEEGTDSDDDKAGDKPSDKPGDKPGDKRGKKGGDSFAAYRIDEQIAKGLDRKVWLPSGGSLIIDRTEAMTVVDVNTGKFTGSGGNLEETVTKNNLEAAEEIVRQLRLRDIGGIIVVDFIDMVLESNRDLVLRRLVECLGRDRTRHQVAEVTSLGLVQMTRKRIGTGLLEVFSETCDHCEGRGVVVHDMPVEPKKSGDGDGRRGRRNRGKGRQSGSSGSGGSATSAKPPSPIDVAAVARPENADKPPLDEADQDEKSADEKSTDEKGTDEAVPAKPAKSEEPAEPTVGEVRPEEPQSEQAAPTVTRSTRTRKSASRPTGVATTPVVAPVAVERTEPTPEPEETPGVTRVVTRSRARRVARVPGSAGTSDAASADEVEPGRSESDPSPADQPELHVPVKKKGR